VSEPTPPAAEQRKSVTRKTENDDRKTLLYS